MKPPAEKPNLRVAILGTKGIPARYGGFETFAEQLAIRLVKRGHAVTVYAENPGPHTPADEWVHGVRVRFRRMPRWGGASVLAYDCACLWDARGGYDVVYMLGYGAAWACWWPRVFGVPVWINVDGLEWRRSKWGYFTRIYLRLMEWTSSWAATRVIADAQAIADRFHQLYPKGAPCDCIAYGADVVDEHAIDSRMLERWELVPYQYLLVVARPEPENHVQEIIEGYLQHHGEWPLIVVGDVSGATPYQHQLLEMAGPRVRFIGGIYDARLLQGLRLFAAAYLHGHSVGGTNPSLLEAMACGNWIVAHDNPFNREVARDAAEYFDTPRQLAACLDDWVRRIPAEREARGARARQIVQSFYDWDRITASYEALLHEQCGQKREGNSFG